MSDPLRSQVKLLHTRDSHDNLQHPLGARHGPKILIFLHRRGSRCRKSHTQLAFDEMEVAALKHMNQNDHDLLESMDRRMPSQGIIRFA